MRSADRLLDIIEELLARPGQTLTELSEALGLPKPTVLRFLRSLSERRWVQRLSDDTYEIGRRIGPLAGDVARLPD
jgi:DNA-binding IclR family transcriptional regulator